MYKMFYIPTILLFLSTILLFFSCNQKDTFDDKVYFINDDEEFNYFED